MFDASTGLAHIVHALTGNQMEVSQKQATASVSPSEVAEKLSDGQLLGFEL